MNFRGLIKRAEDVDKAIQDLQIDLADALDASLDADDLAPPESDDVPDAQAAADDGPPQADAANDDNAGNAEDAGAADSSETAPRLTAHTQTRLAALSAFEGLFHDARDYLEEINDKLSEIGTSHHLTREFLNILHSDILRANELEVANAALAAEQRALSEKLHDATRSCASVTALSKRCSSARQAWSRTGRRFVRPLPRSGWNSSRQPMRAPNARRSSATSPSG